MAQAKSIEVTLKGREMDVTMKGLDIDVTLKGRDTDVMAGTVQLPGRKCQFTEGQGCSNLNYQVREGMFQINKGTTSILYPLDTIDCVEVVWPE